MSLLHIKNLRAEVDGKEILQGLNLEIKAGEIHALMGPNGAGKSTLAKVLGGHLSYDILEGSVTLAGEELLGLDPEERAVKGLFMSFQYPVEIPGVNNLQFLHSAYSAVHGKMELSQFETLLTAKMEQMQVPLHFKQRNVNEGFSGGEKKRSEILQMALLDPKMAILDETDSGLDIDALRIVASGVKQLMTPSKGLLLITHYQRLLGYIEPHFVHVMIGGKIVKSGGPSLALQLEEEGYDWLS
ncbi:MAG: Fe-S cluster assembly ATPase SufC [Verrucomicrobia bacterium]|nr:Fe-S cluster assembly ATPase SufC [Verrucomicrobiota bacterium]